MRALVRVVYWILAIVVAAVAFATWHFVYRPLPQVDGAVVVAGLREDVTVTRDQWGVPRIRANSLEDMVEAQGYVMAQDRLWQMDLMRRVGRGQLSEVLGAATIKVDQQFRTLGFARAAARDAADMDPDMRVVMEAYARGVNKFIEQHENQLPLEFSLLRYKPQPWTPADSFVISGYMYRSLTDTWERELDRAKVSERLSTERAEELFSDEAAMDHFVLGDRKAPNDGTRHAKDKKQDEDPDDISPDTVLKADGADPNGRLDDASAPDLTTALLPEVAGFLRESNREIRAGLGSNNWVVSGAHTATGKPLLANDTHLEMSVPSIWYQLHLSSPGWNVKGFTLPGAPLVVIGHNEKIAWGFTNNGADVQDLYSETFNPAAPDEYRVKNAWVPAEVVDEVIKVKGQSDEHFKVVITRHGPVVKREGDKWYALKWTATEPGGLSNTYNFLGKAQNWEQFREAMKKVAGPAQNAVYADVAGNIGYIMAARVPIRKRGKGQVPVPGNTDDYEWTGYVPFEQLPQALNPESGFIATANARVVGPEYKPYLTDRWEEPYRTARIFSLLHGKNDLRPEDMLKAQTDTYTYPHVFLAEELIAASKKAQAKDERAQKLVANLQNWNGSADVNSVEISFLEATRKSAIELLLEPYLGSETALYAWRKTTFLQKVLTDRPAKWLPTAFKSYDDLLIAAADRAVGKLAEESKSEKIQDWGWKNFNSLQMMHPIGRTGLLKRMLSMTDRAQAGTLYSVRAASPTHGPAMRFVADLADWDDSILLITTGESGQFGSRHYMDEFKYWFDGQPITSQFSEAGEAAATKHTLTLQAAQRKIIPVRPAK